MILAIRGRFQFLPSKKRPLVVKIIKQCELGLSSRVQLYPQPPRKTLCDLAPLVFLLLASPLIWFLNCSDLTYRVRDCHCLRRVHPEPSHHAWHPIGRGRLGRTTKRNNSYRVIQPWYGHKCIFPPFVYCTMWKSIKSRADYRRRNSGSTVVPGFSVLGFRALPWFRALNAGNQI